MAVPTTNLDRTQTVTLANPTPPTNVVVNYQGTPPTPRGLAVAQAPEPDTLNAWLLADPLNGAADPELSGLAEAEGTEISTAIGSVTNHSVQGNYSEFHFHPSEVDPVFGPELVTLGDFSASTGWTLSGGAMIGTGTLNMDGTGAGTATRTAGATLTAGAYLFSFDVVETSGAPITVGVGGTTKAVVGSELVGRHVGSITTAASTQIVGLFCSGSVVKLDNFSVKRKL